MTPSGAAVYSTLIAFDPNPFGSHVARVLGLAIRADGAAFVAWHDPPAPLNQPTEIRVSSVASDGTIVEPGAAIATFAWSGPSKSVSVPTLSFTSAGTLHAAACRIANTSVPPDICLRVDMDRDGGVLATSSAAPSHRLAFGADGSLYSATGTNDVTITKYARITLATLNASVPLPSLINHPITWTAVTDSALPTEYTFLRFDPGAGWVVAQPYGPSNTYTWTPGPTDGGNHTLQVWVRAAGSGDAYEDWLGTEFTIDGLTPTVTRAHAIGAGPGDGRTIGHLDGQHLRRHRPGAMQVRAPRCRWLARGPRLQPVEHLQLDARRW